MSGIELAPDRRHAFVAFYPNSSLEEVDLATVAERRFAAGGSPALDPLGIRLAFVSLAKRADIVYRTAVVILNLRTGRRRLIPFGRKAVWGTPPEVLLNWSPEQQDVARRDSVPVDEQPALPVEPARDTVAAVDRDATPA